MKKIIFWMLLGFYGVSAQAADIDIPMFGDGQMPTEAQKKENIDFPLFLPPTAPQNTTKELPFREPLDTKKAVDLSVPEVPVEIPKEESKQKFLPALPKDEKFKLPTSIPPKMKTGIEIKPEGVKLKEQKTSAPAPEKTKAPADPARAAGFKFGTGGATGSKEPAVKTPAGSGGAGTFKTTPSPKASGTIVPRQEEPKPVVPKEAAKPEPVKPAVQSTAPSRPSLLQKSLAIPVAPEQEEFLNPFDVEDVPLADEGLPPEATVLEKKASPVEDMDIMGIYLHMHPQDITDEAQLRGFRVSHIAHALPTFATTRLEKDCRREEGLLQIEMVQNCVRERAQKEGIYYISELKFKNEETKETLIAKFSSHFTDNKAYYIEYTAPGDNSLGTSIPAIAQKATRRDLFWELVFEKYGTPTFAEQHVWGDPREMYFKAYMEGMALNGKLILEDKVLPQDDISEAHANLPPPPEINFFSFTE